MTEVAASARRSSSPEAAGLLLRRVGRAVALAGLVLPLLLIGLTKFEQSEVDALKPLFAATPWLGWLPALLGDVGASRFLGVVELIAAALLIASPFSAVIGVIGGALAAGIFAATTSVLFALPIWDEDAGGFPWLSGDGAFLIKDVAMLGIAIVILGESLLTLGSTRSPAPH